MMDNLWTKEEQLFFFFITGKFLLFYFSIFKLPASIADLLYIGYYIPLYRAIKIVSIKKTKNNYGHVIPIDISLDEYYISIIDI